MKLAPSGGAPAAGSVDKHLDDILTNVPDVISLAAINAQVDTALSDIKLDHLVAVADSDDPVDNSIIAKLASSSADWSTFVSADDALQAIRDRGDAAWSSAAGHPDVLESTTIATLASQISFTLTDGSADDNAYNDALIIVTDAVTAEINQARRYLEGLDV